MTPTAPEADVRDRRTRNTVHAAYGLYALSLFLGAPLLAGVVIAYLKRRDAAGTFYRSHVDWLIRTFWIAVVVAIIGTVLSIVLIGVPILVLLGVWFVYRVVKGWLLLAEDRPVGDVNALL